MKTNQIIASVGLIAVIGFAIMPLQKMASEEATQNLNLFTKKQQQIEQLEKLEKIAAAGSHEKYIPDSPEELSMANDLKLIAKKTGITLPADWNFNTNYNSEINAEQIGVSFPIKGKRQQIMSFLSEVEKNPRFLGVKDFEMKTDFDSSLALTEMNVDIYGFFLGEK